MSAELPNVDLTVSDVLSCYDLDAKHIATMEMASMTDTPEALEALEPALTEACRALRVEANAEAQFNEQYRVDE